MPASSNIGVQHSLAAKNSGLRVPNKLKAQGSKKNHDSAALTPDPLPQIATKSGLTEPLLYPKNIILKSIYRNYIVF
ncbi:MAG: hypothetical protein BA873_10080 [Desulfobulbaceae bacterium C00003063]|nr:MAG: hypothetical protein BA873_10080 [Desulfobulbaceae bacterium C00003063]